MSELQRTDAGEAAEEAEMIIETRYRDVPWEETLVEGHIDDPYNRERWPKNRGNATYIRTPAENHAVAYGCTQPRYVVVDKTGKPAKNKRGRGVSVCSHIVEIGD